MDNIKQHIEGNMKYMLFGMNEKVVKPEIWHQEGFHSTDCGEDNDETDEEEEEDSDYDEDEFEYYDEEEEAEQEEDESKGVDPSEMIKKDKIPKEEQAMMEN